MFRLISETAFLQLIFVCRYVLFVRMMLLLCNFFLANAVYIFWTVKSALLAKYFQFSWYPSFIIDYLLLSYWHTHIECSVHGSKYHLLVKQCIIFSFTLLTQNYKTSLFSLIHKL